MLRTWLKSGFNSAARRGGGADDQTGNRFTGSGRRPEIRDRKFGRQGDAEGVGRAGRPLCQLAGKVRGPSKEELQVGLSFVTSIGPLRS